MKGGTWRMRSLRGGITQRLGSSGGGIMDHPENDPPISGGVVTYRMRSWERDPQEKWGHL